MQQIVLMDQRRIAEVKNLEGRSEADSLSIVNPSTNLGQVRQITIVNAGGSCAVTVLS